MADIVPDTQSNGDKSRVTPQRFRAEGRLLTAAVKRGSIHMASPYVSIEKRETLAHACRGAVP
jgi:hypothetical protein